MNRLRSVHADVANKIDIETAMSFVQKYHDNGGEGRLVFNTRYGSVVVFSDEDMIYVAWDDTEDNHV